MFTGLAPSESVYSLRLLRMVLNGQRPRHPGRLAEVLGLDETYWQLCLRCWSRSATMDDIVAALEVPQLNVVRCPVRWDLAALKEFTARSAPPLARHIRQKQQVRLGRDIECSGFEVHAVLHTDRNRVEAVNIIPPHAHRRRLGKLGTNIDFLSELFVWSQLRHEHILPVLGSYIGGVDERECFVVPRMTGGTCRDYLRENDSPDRLRILSEVADALHYLHSRSPKIIHGDVRSHSVFISESGTAFLGNFDFSTLQHPLAHFDDSDNYQVAQRLRWLAPEVGTGMTPRSTRADVFSFALFGYEVFSGRVPFYETDPGEAGEFLIRNKRPPRPETDQLSDEVWTLIQRCWRKVTPARPTMDQASRRLRELRQAETGINVYRTNSTCTA
ncbi:kinase-like protein [Exidia glandulosa HHB12029]|uniref:Kinase-like protein n=1 Tax=Exidia glandulosa HHB12029 TaxID=1314781 RepID=A0A165DGE1_EXIGL|nr:kinase-like protein [Exidia glandulosa HHB12029]